MSIAGAVPSRDGTHPTATSGAADCDRELPRRATGRPARFCSAACRMRSHRQQRPEPALPVTVEVDMGSASSRGRLPERSWIVRMRREDRSVIVAIGLPRAGADRLAEQIADLLNRTP